MPPVNRLKASKNDTGFENYLTMHHPVLLISRKAMPSISHSEGGVCSIPSINLPDDFLIAVAIRCKSDEADLWADIVDIK
tara:strand:- start:115 stop:354 length:240 start_codon:yes stop_codon:yes gene_type:complete